MSAAKNEPGTEVVLPGRPAARQIQGDAVSITDLKRRAEYIRELAVTGVEKRAQTVVKATGTQAVIIGAVAVVAVIGIAYFIGRSTAKQMSQPWCPPGCRPE
jgi:hypothetical protein